MSKYHEVPKLINKKINNQPLLATEDSLRAVVDYLENRDSAHMGISQDDSQRTEMSMTDDIAIIPITGNLVYEKSWMNALCGMTSYQNLLENVEKALSLGIKTIVFDADSGGGEAFAMMSTANAIKKRISDAGAKSITYIDGLCASACFGLAAISDEIISHPDSQTGSVGVVVRLMNDSEYKKKEGLQTTYITSANSKVPFDADGAFKEDFLTDMQEKVDSLHTQFAQHIAENRDMSLEDVNGTQAKTFSADKALEIGFVDAVMDHDTFYEYLENINEDTMPLTKFSSSKEDQQKLETEENMKLEEMQTALDTATTALADAEKSITEMTSQVEALTQANQELTEQVATLEQDKQTAKLEARKEKLTEVLAEDKVESIFEATKDLDDSAFEAVVGGYAAASAALENTEMFEETGVDGEGEQLESQPETSSVMKLIQQRKANSQRKAN